MTPTHDPLAEYFDSLREERLSPTAEARLKERHVGRFALVATPVAAADTMVGAAASWLRRSCFRRGVVGGASE